MEKRWNREGTMLVKNIRSGSQSADPLNLINVNGTLFFTAYGGSGFQVELWKSDGTTAGTVMVKDINPGSVSSNPGNFTSMGSKLFFTATDGVHGTELWKSDGTEDSTVMVKDILPGASGNTVYSMTSARNHIYFCADDGAHGKELWKSDGTEAGTQMVKDISPGLFGSYFLNFITMNDSIIYFVSVANNANRGLWKSDGTDAGTVKLNTGIFDSLTGSQINNLYASGNILFFVNFGYQTGSPLTGTGAEPWRTDGTDAGTFLLKDIDTTNMRSGRNKYCLSDSILFFAASDGRPGEGLWKTNGTTEGTVLLKRISSLQRRWLVPGQLLILMAHFTLPQAPVRVYSISNCGRAMVPQKAHKW